MTLPALRDGSGGDSVAHEILEQAGVSGAPLSSNYRRRLLFVVSEAARKTRTAMGAYLLRSELSNAVRNRVQLMPDLGASPDATPLGEPPIVIIGMPRSGTTLLHHLLALDHQNRTLSVGEALRPSRDNTPSERESAARERADLVQRLRPSLMRIHPPLSWGPEECNVLELADLASLQLALYLDSPAYIDWYLNSDLEAHYHWLMATLHGLGRDRGQVRWVLKSPGHAAHIPELHRAIGGPMRVVVIRRNEHEMVASWCSLARETSRLFGSDGSLAIDWSTVWETVNGRVAHTGASASLDVVQIEFHDLLSDTVGTVESLYTSLALPFSSELRAKIADFVRLEPLRCWGRHVYHV
jgi:hypothetical protein